MYHLYFFNATKTTHWWLTNVLNAHKYWWWGSCWCGSGKPIAAMPDCCFLPSGQQSKWPTCSLTHLKKKKRNHFDHLIPTIFTSCTAEMVLRSFDKGFRLSSSSLIYPEIYWFRSINMQGILPCVFERLSILFTRLSIGKHTIDHVWIWNAGYIMGCFFGRLGHSKRSPSQ